MSIQEIRGAIRMRFYEIDPETPVPDSLVDMLADSLANGEQLIIESGLPKQ